MTNDEIVAALQLTETAVDDALEFAKVGDSHMAVNRLVVTCKTYNHLVKDLLLERLANDQKQLQVFDAFIVSLGANNKRRSQTTRLREYLRSWRHGPRS